MQRFLWSIYSYAFLDQFLLIYPVYPLLFQVKGLSAFQIGLLFTIWSFSTVILEVPTGMLADRYSRKAILSAAQIIKGITFALWLMSNSFLGFASGFVLWAFSSALVSGTFEAFIFDELTEMKKEDAFERINGITRGYYFAGMTLAVFLGGLVAELGFMFVLVPSILIPLLGAFVIIITKPAQRATSTEEIRYWHLLRNALKEAKHNPPLLKIMLMIALVFGATTAGDELWTLYLEEAGLSFAWIGFVLGMANIAASLGGFTAHLLPLRNKRLPTYILLGSLITFFIAQVHIWLSVILIMILIYIIESSKVKYEARLQQTISSNQRATVSSINNLLLQFVALFFFFVSGIFANSYGYISFLWLLGIIMGGVALLSIVWPRKRYNHLHV